MVAISAPRPPARPGHGSPLRQPPGLLILCLTELWERFSYYGTRALLVLYLVGYLGYGDETALMIFGAYTSTVYFTGVVGGLMGDRVIGARRSVVLGGALILVAHGGLALHASGAAATGAHELLFGSLAVIAIGTGLLKPNSTALVGMLYAAADPRRDSGFTLFYVGINAGAVVAPLVCGFLGHAYGWAYGFGAAGAGMAVGLATFIVNRRRIEAALGPGDDASPTRRGAIATAVGLAAMVAAIWWVLRHPAAYGVALLAGGIVVIGAAARIIWQAEGAARATSAFIFGHIAVSIIFWMLLDQAGGSLNLLADRFVERSIFGVVIPASMFQALEPLYVMLLGPLFSAAWLSLARRRLGLSVSTKFAIGLLALGLGLSLMAVQIRMNAPGALLPLGSVLLLYFAFAIGECFLGPAGLAMTGWLAGRTAGIMAGIWYFGMAVGGYLAGLTASSTNHGGSLTELATYGELYGDLGALGLAAGALLLSAAPFLQWLIAAPVGPTPARAREFE